ncbi:MAG: hypothetical protein F6K22_05670 [Okeania sp. SIO2F4]|uniref:hypothetical protein n=1 Tax=Okeania sp. SIO2F4 TaxID=2607790 RepID=UPI001429FDDB|nr:hypothetical protein [Okeania sp. SIO2F4]
MYDKYSTGFDIIGGDGNDYLYGESDLDTLKGGNGNDYLDGSYGRDRLFSGNDNDILVIRTRIFSVVVMVSTLLFDYDSSFQSGVLSVVYLDGNAALRSNLATIQNLASASAFNINNDVQLV